MALDTTNMLNVLFLFIANKLLYATILILEES